MSLLATIEGGVYQVAAATSENHVVIDSNGYDVIHLGLDAAGSADTNAVYISQTAGITASPAAGAKYTMKSGSSFSIPEDWRTVYFKTASGAPMLSFLPKKGN